MEGYKPVEMNVEKENIIEIITESIDHWEYMRKVCFDCFNGKIDRYIKKLQDLKTHYNEGVSSQT